MCAAGDGEGHAGRAGAAAAASESAVVAKPHQRKHIDSAGGSLAQRSETAQKLTGGSLAQCSPMWILNVSVRGRVSLFSLSSRLVTVRNMNCSFIH